MPNKRTNVNMGKSFSREYFYWSMHFAAITVLSLCLILTFLPSIDKSTKESLGLVNFCADLLPNRRWLLVFECTVLMSMMFTYMGLLMYNEDVLTKNLDDITTIIDKDGNLVITNDTKKFIQDFAQNETSGIADLPIMDVCQILYAD
ncbi:hypothetical protein TBLA_0A06990 [Henningerozyma blattae CBS 6284]|uniref:PIG-P domain-containing protein n=1 Tax=Henningerozyma blattae (strain ATCC 34711 / CBS 6284 / DSM 70876 / NBRC 10599 / NRRL Y-10934 / UCD 77-7) TaxID=1071380 RepID=I2GWI8_HENB6|nr:hypothetical protein TBLA_0A06990 [Tetrapisispora blattae CBS 6284]CCH58490.1 hypothetical protein TBLA_0A06990 [Tetrapisispora blattae CBS 6284]